MSRTLLCVPVLLAVSCFPSLAEADNSVRLVPPAQPKRLGIHARFVRLNDQVRPLVQTRIRPDFEPVYEFGERIDRVEWGSPAQRAGLERGDVVVATYPTHLRIHRWQPIQHRNQLRRAIQLSGPRLKLLVRNVRNGRYQTVIVNFDSFDGPRPLIQRAN